MTATSAADHQVVVRGRLKRLRQHLVRAKLDAVLVLEEANLYYLTGFHTSNGAAVVTADAAAFFTDFRYIESAERAIPVYDVRRFEQRSLADVTALLKLLKARRVGFEGTASWSRIQQARESGPTLKWQEGAGVLLGLRAVKEARETALIARNQLVNQRMQAAGLSALARGVSELNIQRAIRGAMLTAGGEEGFTSIVAAGANSSLPHASSSPRKVRSGDFLLLDTGFRANHYHSDLTRTYIVDRAQPWQKEIYEVVREAQFAALAAIRPGVKGSTVDAAARKVIQKAGYGDFFGHGLGHGVGLEIHEWPVLNASSTHVLRAGMIVTVEPGIYLPGRGGVRIEDLVAVTAKGYENLTTLPKTLKIRRLP